jgi:hypothetical protein
MRVTEGEEGGRAWTPLQALEGPYKGEEGDEACRRSA